MEKHSFIAPSPQALGWGTSLVYNTLAPGKICERNGYSTTSHGRTEKRDFHLVKKAELKFYLDKLVDC